MPLHRAGAATLNILTRSIPTGEALQDAGESKSRMGRKDGFRLKRRKKNSTRWKTKTKHTPGRRLWRLITTGCCRFCCCCCSEAGNGLQVMECGDLGCVCVYLQCTLWTTMSVFRVCFWWWWRSSWCVAVSAYTYTCCLWVKRVSTCLLRNSASTSTKLSKDGVQMGLLRSN